MILPGGPESDGGRLHAILVSLGYAVLGATLTGVVALVVLNATLSVQTAIYEVFYLRVGPADATVTAILGQFLLAIVCGLIVAMTVASWLNTRRENLPVVGRATIGLATLLLVYLLIILLRVPAQLAVLTVLGIGLLGVPLLLRYRYGIRSGSVPAVIGSIPVILVLLLLAGIGAGWGWGYVMTAEEVPSAEVEGPVADFDTVPAVRDDLLGAGDCEEVDGHQRCRLQLRGYDHDVTAVRFMDRSGIRCPAQTASGGTSASFFAEHDGTYYRVTCSSHGD